MRALHDPMQRSRVRSSPPKGAIRASAELRRTTPFLFALVAKIGWGQLETHPFTGLVELGILAVVVVMLFGKLRPRTRRQADVSGTPDVSTPLTSQVRQVSPPIGAPPAPVADDTPQPIPRTRPTTVSSRVRKPPAKQRANPPAHSANAPRSAMQPSSVLSPAMTLAPRPPLAPHPPPSIHRRSMRPPIRCGPPSSPPRVGR